MSKIAYTVAEAMAAIGIGRTKFYELANAGKIDLRIVGGRTVATAASLHRLVEEADPYVSTQHHNSARQRANPKGGRGRNSPPPAERQDSDWVPLGPDMRPDYR